MRRISVDFQAGFADDDAVIRIDGREFWRGRLRTDYSIGLAERVMVDLPAEGGVLGIELPSRGKRLEKRLRPDAPGYVGLSITDSELELRESAEPFPYF